MAAPIYLSSTSTYQVVTVLFDQTLIAPLGRPGEGFSLFVNGVSRAMNAAVQATTSVSNDSVALTVQGVVSVGDLVQVSYNPATGNLVNGAAQAPVAFTTNTSTNNSIHAGQVSRVIASLGTDPSVITVSFSKAVTASNFLTGLSATLNGAALTISGGAVGANPLQVLLTMAQAVQFSDVVTISYLGAPGGGTWTSGVAIAPFTSLGVINASKLGTPSALYPLSTVVAEQLASVQGVVTGTIGVSLNPVDRLVVGRVGPAQVDFGGTYGVSGQNPLGVVVPSRIIQITDGVQVSQSFTFTGHPEYASVAGADWLVQSRLKVATELNRVRLLDAQVSLGNRVVTPV